MEYNNAGNRGCRIGNWIEERDLEEASEESRKNILAHGDGHTVPRYSMTQQMLRDGRPSATQDPRGLTKGPRARLLEERFLEEAKREEESKQSDMVRKNNLMAPFETTSGQCYGQRSEMRPIQYARETDRDEAAGADADVDYATPISIYTQRLVEGSFFVTPTTSSNPFARNTGFTNEVSAADKFHLDCEDGHDFATKAIIGRSMKASNGAHATRRRLFKEIQTFLHDALVSPNQVHEIVAANVSGHTVTETQLRTILRELRVPLSERERLAVVHFCVGLSPDEVVRNLLAQPQASFRGGLPSSAAAEPTAAESWPRDSLIYEAVIVRVHNPAQEQIRFGIPKHLLAQPLSFPQDIPVIKAVLRKQGIVVGTVLSLTALSS